jgi:hypothetical protein
MGDDAIPYAVWNGPSGTRQRSLPRWSIARSPKSGKNT